MDPQPVTGSSIVRPGSSDLALSRLIQCERHFAPAAAEPKGGVFADGVHRAQTTRLGWPAALCLWWLSITTHSADITLHWGQVPGLEAALAQSGPQGLQLQCTVRALLTGKHAQEAGTEALAPSALIRQQGLMPSAPHVSYLSMASCSLETSPTWALLVRAASRTCWLTGSAIVRWQQVPVQPLSIVPIRKLHVLPGRVCCAIQ